jgi:hypothetical protein
MFAHTILKFDDQKIRSILEKKMIFCNKFAKVRCSIIVVSYTCDEVDLYQFHYMKKLEVYLGDLILKHVMCKILMRGPHNLSTYAKVIKNNRGPSC